MAAVYDCVWKRRTSAPCVRDLLIEGYILYTPVKPVDLETLQSIVLLPHIGAYERTVLFSLYVQ